MKYKKLKGGTRAFGARVSYWLGDDHLLLVSKNYLHESYRRVYFSDIVGIAMRRNAKRAWATGVLLGIGLLFLMLMLIPKQGPEAFVWIAFFAVFAVIAGIIFFLGPTCDVTIRTAAGLTEMTGLRRIPAAKKFFAKLEPFLANPPAPADALAENR